MSFKNILDDIPHLLRGWHISCWKW